MTDISSIYALGLFTLATALLFLRYLSCQPRRCVRRAASPESIRALLDPAATSLSASLRARALANRRLVLAFNLTNTFVSSDKDGHSAFLRRAQDILRAQNRCGWNRFLEVSLQAVDLTLSDRLEEYSAFVQAVTLRVAIAGLLDTDRDVTALDARDVCAVASLITELWSLSKTVDVTNTSAVLQPSKLACLNEHLRRLLPDSEAYRNPIDFVIPTWETLWRVVATCIAHVCRNEDYKVAFRDLRNTPDAQQFNSVGSAGVSVKAIVMECLRLYPPSRHISRSVIQRHRFANLLPERAARMFDRIQVEVAEVESVHHSTEIWGLDAHAFNPSRHDAATPSIARQATFFAFGYGPLQCSGKGWAPMAVGCIVAAILERTESGEMAIRAGDHIGGRAGWDGWSVEGLKAKHASD